MDNAVLLNLVLWLPLLGVGALLVVPRDNDRLTRLVTVGVMTVPVSYTHLRAHETVLDLVCRLLLEKKKQNIQHTLHHQPTHKMKTHDRLISQSSQYWYKVTLTTTASHAS